jgi:hypothetical protein
MRTSGADGDLRPASRGGSKLLGIGVAGLGVVYLVVLPAVLVLLIYLFISVYAVVKISPPGHPNPAVVLIGVVLLTGLMTVLLGVSIWLIGRMFDPPKTRG